MDTERALRKFFLIQISFGCNQRHHLVLPSKGNVLRIQKCWKAANSKAILFLSLDLSLSQCLSFIQLSPARGGKWLPLISPHLYNHSQKLISSFWIPIPNSWVAQLVSGVPLWPVMLLMAVVLPQYSPLLLRCLASSPSRQYPRTYCPLACGFTQNHPATCWEVPHGLEFPLSLGQAKTQSEPQSHQFKEPFHSS